jgi:hypothetical protein
MADQDARQSQGTEESHSVFHDLGQHLANAVQEFLNAKKSYGESQTPQTPEQIQAGQVPSPQPTSTQPIPEPNPQQIEQAQPAVQQQPMVPQTVPQTAPMVPQTGPTPGTIDPIQAEANLAKSTGSVSQDIQNTLGQGIEQQQQMLQDAKKRFNDNKAQDQALSQAYQSGKIKPMAMFSGNTAQNIGTALGLLFSGIGSGLTGQKNLALETINNTINRDMEAQKLNQEKEYNAYRMHRENTQDQFSADMAFQRDAMVAMNNQIEMQKTKLMGPQAQAAAAQTQLALKGQIIDLNQKQAMWDAMRGQLNGAQSGDPASQIRRMQMTGLLQPAQAEQAYKELDRTQNFGTQKQNILDSFDRANQENTIAGRAAHLGATPASVAALQNQIMPFLKDAEGRINETEIKRTDELIPKPGDGPHKIAEKRQALEDFMNEKASSSMLRGIGVQTPQIAAKKQSGIQQANYQEGQRTQSKSGKPIIFRNGQWVYE